MNTRSNNARALGSIPPKRPRLFRLRHGMRELLLSSGMVTLGRKASCDYVLHDTKVSREHARIIIGGRTIAVEDLGSANGVFVNEQQIEGLQRMNHGDKLRVGSQIFTVEEVGDDEPTNENEGDEMTVISQKPRPSMLPLDEEYEDRPTKVLDRNSIE